MDEHVTHYLPGALKKIPLKALGRVGSVLYRVKRFTVESNPYF